MPNLHLIEGPVGAGKSTYARKLSHAKQAPHLNLDEWMVTLFRPDRPADDTFMDWYVARKQRCIEQIWLHASDLLDLQLDVILELGLVQQADREAFYARVDATDWALQVTVLDVPEAERWRRVQARNAQQTGTYRMQVDRDVFELASRTWQPPDDAETAARGIEWVTMG